MWYFIYKSGLYMYTVLYKYYDLVCRILGLIYWHLVGQVDDTLVQ